MVSGGIGVSSMTNMIHEVGYTSFGATHVVIQTLFREDKHTTFCIYYNREVK